MPPSIHAPVPVPVPSDEVERLAQLHGLFVLDSAPEPVFDAIARLASEVCGTPIALITLIDNERQWFKANVGFPGVNETPRNVSFCAHAIMSDEILEVPDTALDSRFSDLPSVTSSPGICFYAGAPLVMPGGERLGTLCIADTRPRRLSAGQARTLKALSGIVTQALTMRRDLILKSLSVRSEHERELQRTKDELRDLTEEQRATLDTDMIGIVKLRDRKVVWANPGMERIIGFGPGELIGLPTRIIYHDEESHLRVGAEAYSAMSTGSTFRKQLQMATKNGRQIWVDIMSMAMPNRPGDTLCMLVDITALKEAEEVRVRTLSLEAENRQLVESSRIKSLFLTNMSHELRTPLNAVIGYAGLLGTGKVMPDSPKFARYLTQIGESGKQLLGLTDAVLEFANAESGKIEIAAEPISLSRLAGDVVEMMRAEIRHKDIAIDIDIHAAVETVVCDPLRLTQVLSQLLSNAIKFSPRRATVSLRARAEPPTAFSIEVQDHGIGIPEKDFPRLFKAFRQLSEGNSKAYPGAGLGLALSQKLVEAMNGTLGVESVEGVGSTFRLVLPQ